MNDGLQSNEFNGGSYHRGHDGRLFFGGVYGLNVIDPEMLEPIRNVTEVTLTKLEVLGKEVRVAGVDLEEEFEEYPGRIVEFEGEYYSSENVHLYGGDRAGLQTPVLLHRIFCTQ